jgi:hypothetical protein
MNNFTPSQFTQYIIDIAVILIAGVGEYLHLIPAGTFSSLLLIVIGHLFGAIPTTVTAVALNANTQATIANTQASSVPIIQEKSVS